jgi:hypothetical protein
MDSLIPALTTLLQQLPGKILVSLTSTIVLLALSLISKSVRYTLLYKRHEYVFEYDSDFGGCEWDIQWEAVRLTIEVADVHNEYLEGVLIKRHGENPGKTYPALAVSNTFEMIPKWPLHFKVSSIVRTSPRKGVREYQVVFVIRRRRF